MGLKILPSSHSPSVFLQGSHKSGAFVGRGGVTKQASFARSGQNEQQSLSDDVAGNEGGL
jgi:hypothetical protein